MQIGERCFGHVPVVGDDLQTRDMGLVDEVLDDVVTIEWTDGLLREPPRIVVARLDVPRKRSRPQCREGGSGVFELWRVAVEREPKASVPLHPVGLEPRWQIVPRHAIPSSRQLPQAAGNRLT